MLDSLSKIETKPKDSIQNAQNQAHLSDSKAQAVSRKAFAPVEGIKAKWEDLGCNTKISTQSRQTKKIYDVIRVVLSSARAMQTGGTELDTEGLSQVIRGLPRRNNESSLQYIQRLRTFLQAAGIPHFDADLAALEKLASSGDGLKLR